MVRRGRPAAGERRRRVTEPTERNEQGMSRRTKILLTVLVVAIAGSLAGVGTFAVFTSSESVAPEVAAGTVEIEFDGGEASDTLDVAATNIAPTDTIERSITLENAGSLDLSEIELTTEATTSSLLDTNTDVGLQMNIDKCSQPWTESGTAPAFTYTCGGTEEVIVEQQPIIGTFDLGDLEALEAGGISYLRVFVTLPEEAGNEFQGLSSVIRYTFDATQRTGQSR